MPQNYYISRQNKLIKSLTKNLKGIFSYLEDYYGKDTAQKIVSKTLIEFELLIPQIPYIGGKANGLTSLLEQSAYGLALYKAIKQYGGTLDQTGCLIEKSLSVKLDRIPIWIKK